MIGYEILKKGSETKHTIPVYLIDKDHGWGWCYTKAPLDGVVIHLSAAEQNCSGLLITKEKLREMYDHLFPSGVKKIRVAKIQLKKKKVAKKKTTKKGNKNKGLKK